MWFSSVLCPYLCQEGLAPAVAAVLGRSCVCHSGRAEQAAASRASSMKWHNTKQPLPNFSLLVLPHQRGVREELRSALMNFSGQEMAQLSACDGVGRHFFAKSQRIIYLRSHNSLIHTPIPQPQIITPLPLHLLKQQFRLLHDSKAVVAS